MSVQKLTENTHSTSRVEELRDEELDNVQGGAKGAPTIVSQSAKPEQGINWAAPKGMERVFEDE